jgi:hypothetical protein
VLCSKSRWQPAIRREHALASIAAERGCSVTFVETAVDARALGIRWFSGLGGRTGSASAGIELVERSTLAPPYRGAVARASESRLLRRILRDHDRPGTSVVATTPWQWDAVAGLNHARRIYDCADDWSVLVPRRAADVRESLIRVRGAADAIVAATATLAGLFFPREAAIVRNGADRRLLATPLTPPPHALTLGYAGTLSERLDIRLVTDLMLSLRGWRLDLYGECRYAGRGGSPSPELAELLERFAGRVAWHGVVERDELAGKLDAARVLLLPHRRAGAVTGDSMKLYDYAARGRPIVSTAWADGLETVGPPGLILAESAPAFVEAVRASGEHDPGDPAARRRWARQNTWAARWPDWAAAVLGP